MVGGDRDRIEDQVTAVAMDRLGDDLVAIYTYGSSTTDVEYSDVDIMIVIDNFLPDRAERIRSTSRAIYNAVSQFDTALDLFIYGREEIPSADSGGYGIFTSIFQVDYRTNRRLLYGEDVLAGLPPIDVETESLRMLRGCRRLLRHLLVNPTPDTMLSRVIVGQGRLDFQRPVATETDDQVVSLVRYLTAIACKCRLEADGIHKVATERIITAFLDQYPEHADRITAIRDAEATSSLDWTHFEFVREALLLVDDCYAGVQDV